MKEIDFKQYFWVVTVATIAVCAVFAAKGVNHYLEGKYLLDKATSRPVRKATRSPATRPKVRDKSGKLLARRNMFCSDCDPEVDSGGDTPDVELPSDGTIPATSLPLRLVAISLSKNATSLATIRNTSSAHQGAYIVGDSIPNAGELKSIHGKYITFRNDKSRRLEQIALLGKTEAVSRSPKPTVSPRRRPSGNRSELAKAIDEGIKKVGENEYEVERSLVNRLIEDPMSIKGARVVPSIKNGKSQGFRLYAIRPSSVFAKLGIKNGDTVHAINGFELTNMNKALEVYSKLKQASSLSVSVTRRGKPISLSYTIR